MEKLVSLKANKINFTKNPNMEVSNIVIHLQVSSANIGQWVLHEDGWV